MSINEALRRFLVALSIAAGAPTLSGAADPAPAPATEPEMIRRVAFPDCADFSLPINAFFTAAQLSDRIADSGPDFDSRPVARVLVKESGSSTALFHESTATANFLNHWTPQTRRERRHPRVEPGDFVTRTYYDGLRLVESLAGRLRLDRSYLNDVELQETSLATRFKRDTHDVRSVLSPKRITVSVPLYRNDNASVSLEFNADKLYRAVRGDVPQLRGGLRVRF